MKRYVDKIHKLSRNELANLVERLMVSNDQVKKALDEIDVDGNDKKRAKVDDQDVAKTNALVLDDQKKRKEKKKKKEFSMDKFAQRHIALHVAYLGMNYRGLALQDDTPTIELRLFEALEKCCLITDRHNCSFSRCGRTDAGVSALGQILTLTVRSRLRNPEPAQSAIPAKDPPPLKEGESEKQNEVEREFDYPSMLNRLLPEDIMVLGWAPAPSLDYQARFKARSRTYRYYFVRRGLDLDAMRAGAKLLEGTHDFRNLCKMDVVNVKSFEREILTTEIIVCEHDPNVCYLKVQGTAFLWHQIRCIVYVLFLIGKGLEEPQVISKLLDIKNNPRKPAYTMAPDMPLILYHAEYPDDELAFNYNQRVLQKLRDMLQYRHAQHCIQKEMIRGIVETIDATQSEPFQDIDKDFNYDRNQKTYIPLYDRSLNPTLEERLETKMKNKEAKEI